MNSVDRKFVDIIEGRREGFKTLAMVLSFRPTSYFFVFVLPMILISLLGIVNMPEAIPELYEQMPWWAIAILVLVLIEPSRRWLMFLAFCATGSFGWSIFVWMVMLLFVEENIKEEYLGRRRADERLKTDQKNGK